MQRKTLQHLISIQAMKNLLLIESVGKSNVINKLMLITYNV